MSRPVLALDRQCQLIGLPVPTPEVYFAKPRRWRFDWAWEDLKLACEIEGAIFTGGRYTRGVDYDNDCIKYAEALVRGWRVLRVTTGMVADGRALVYVEKMLKAKV